jgi:hypothetical protein
MNLPKFVVTGCSRSGTKYMARLLSAVGHKCSHERVFNLYRYRSPESSIKHFESFPEIQGDSSSDAVLFFDELPSRTVVLHQVRHPVAVIRSLMGIRFFAEPYKPSEYLASDHQVQLEFVEKHLCPTIFKDTNEIARCMRYWVMWNQMAQRAEYYDSLRYFRYRVEDLSLPLLRNIVTLLGGGCGDDVLRAALASVSGSTNSRLRDHSVSWEALPAGDDKDAVEQLAITYRYFLPEKAPHPRPE